MSQLIHICMNGLFFIPNNLFFARDKTKIRGHLKFKIYNA